MIHVREPTAILFNARRPRPRPPQEEQATASQEERNE